MGVYSISDLDRRDLMKMTAALAASVAALSTRRAAAEDLARTPQQILGPFYPLKEFPQTADLTQIPGRPGRAQGQIINVMGRVLNISGDPVRNAMVEVWQANAKGRYTHPSDPNPAPLDPNFDGFAVVTTDAEGRYRFKTIKPAAYPAGPNLIRPAHIHFQVSGRQDRLVTQMYFDGEPYNSTDPFLNSVGRKDLLVTKLVDASPEFEAGSKTAVFDMVIYKG